MATWAELSRESFRAARMAMQNGYYRSSVSRAYYSAYAAVTQALVDRKISFAVGRQGPGHEQLATLVDGNLGKLRGAKRVRANERRLIKANLNMLHENRLDADYRPTRDVEQDVARNSLIAASRIAGTFGISI